MALIARPDLLSDCSPAGIEVFQLTSEPAVPSCHVYMEAQIFAPDSRRLVLHRSAHAHGSDSRDPAHRFLLCDLESDGELSPLTHELGATAACVSPDGQWFYYFVDETQPGGGRLLLKRVRLDGSERSLLCVVDSPIRGTKLQPGQIGRLATISSDGRRICLPAFFGDGTTSSPPVWGPMIFELVTGVINVPFCGPEWGNMHPQYCRSLDPDAAHDLMLQHDHGNHYAPDGTCLGRGAAAYDSVDQTVVVSARRENRQPDQNFTGLGPDVHVIRDDGTNWRSLPWGRDGNELAQGHQCWRGRSTWAITSTLTQDPRGQYLIESQPLSEQAHAGARIAGGVRNRLCRDLPRPAFFHFATDIAGRRIVSDYGPFLNATEIYLGELGVAGVEPARWRFMLDTRGPVRKETQVHPFLSPDGSMAFFNSAESGCLQAYMVRGLENLL